MKDLRRVRIETRRLEGPEGVTSTAHAVHCPVQDATKPLEHCLHCERLVEVEADLDGATFLRCRVPELPAQALGPGVGLVTRLQLTPVSTVMTASVCCIESELTLPEAAHTLDQARITSAPVVDDEGVLVGILSKEDVMRGRPKAAGGERPFPPDCAGVLAEDIMTTDVASIAESASLADAIQLFAERRVHSLPVVSRGDVVVGMLSQTDVMRWLARHFPNGEWRHEADISS